MVCRAGRQNGSHSKANHLLRFVLISRYTSRSEGSWRREVSFFARFTYNGSVAI